MPSESLPEDNGVKLRLPDGSYVMADGSVVKALQAPQPAAQISREIRSGRSATRVLERMHRKLGDLPQGDVKQMNAIAAIIMYTGVGLDNHDIATCLGCDVEMVTSIKELDVYRQLSEMFDTQVFDDAKRTANHILAKAASAAADTMVQALDSPNELVAVNAADRVLKMNGINGEARSAESNKSGLHIKIVRKGEKKSEETITVELNNA